MPEKLISIIDDDESIRRTTTLLIESFGFGTATLNPLKTFLKSGHLDDTSCLIVDVQMPGMNGLELQTHLVKGVMEFRSFSLPPTTATTRAVEHCEWALLHSWVSPSTMDNFYKPFIQ